MSGNDGRGTPYQETNPHCEAGTAVAKLVPADTSSDEFIGRLERIVKIVGDIESPVESPESWETLR
jgi:hypothetical protein